MSNTSTSEVLLTKREEEILQLIVQGYTNNQMGEELNISPKTVDSHRTNMMRKLGAHKVTDLVRYAYLRSMKAEMAV